MSIIHRDNVRVLIPIIQILHIAILNCSVHIKIKWRKREEEKEEGEMGKKEKAK